MHNSSFLVYSWTFYKALVCCVSWQEESSLPTKQTGNLTHLVPPCALRADIRERANSWGVGLLSPASNFIMTFSLQHQLSDHACAWACRTYPRNCIHLSQNSPHELLISRWWRSRRWRQRPERQPEQRGAAPWAAWPWPWKHAIARAGGCPESNIKSLSDDSEHLQKP